MFFSRLSCSSFSSGVFFAKCPLLIMGLTGPTHLDDDGDAYVEDRHWEELAINKAHQVGNHVAVVRSRVFGVEDKEVQHIH